MYDKAQLLHEFARMEHPILAAIFPWITAFLYASGAVMVILLVRAMILRRQHREEPIISLLISLVAFIVIMVLSVAFDPDVSAQGRLFAWCLLSIIPLGILAILEIKYDRSSYHDDEGWHFRPFRYLFFVPLAIIAVQITVIIVKAAMTLPAYVSAIPPHIKYGATQIVAFLSHMSPAQMAALTAAAVLLYFLNQLIDLLKTVLARSR
jgi:hypothetical protein